MASIGTAAPDSFAYRRHARSAIEMMAHLRHDLANFTVLLKDLSQSGARVEGVSGLSADQPVALSLPGRKPALAFVAWANEHCAGLEFANPLHSETFDAILAEFGSRGACGPGFEPFKSAA